MVIHTAVSVNQDNPLNIIHGVPGAPQGACCSGVLAHYSWVTGFHLPEDYRKQKCEPDDAMVEHPAQVKSTLSSGGYLGFELRCYELVPNSGFFLY